VRAAVALQYEGLISILSADERLARILADARPDLKLYLDCFGPNFAEEYSESEWEEKGKDSRRPSTED